MIINADCLDAMRDMEPCSVDAVVCDPPYGLEFMGKEWDKFGRNSPPSFKHSMQNEFKGFKPLPRPGGLKHSGMAALQEFCHAWAVEALRVAKPGAHLLAFGGTRTFHRLACAIEDAGWEIRDPVMWVYGSGFPKSPDVSKSIDTAAGAAREGAGNNANHRTLKPVMTMCGAPHSGDGKITAPATDAARTWAGWGTALKPA